MRLISLNTWGATQGQIFFDYIKEQAKATDIFCFQEIFSAQGSAPKLSSGARCFLFQELVALLPGFKGYFAPRSQGYDFSASDMPKPKRVQGAFITDEETVKVNDFLRMQRPPQYDDEVVSQPVQLNGKGGVVPDSAPGNGDDDDMWRDAVHVVVENRKASTSLLQRRLRIGYGRASRLIDMMEEQGIVSSADGSKPRDVLISSMDDVFGGRDASGVAAEEDAALDEL
jgi:DNA segregation ATPase FtsK/SpoIIIE-like protein